MHTFATDIDLLHWEPNLMREASAVAQTLLSGTGNLSGTTFTISSGSLLAASITNEHVLVIDDPTAGGSFPIVSVADSSSLTLSVLYDELFPDGGGSPEALAPGAAGTGLKFAIRTFWPQRRIVSELLTRAAGVDPSRASSIIDTSTLRRPCVLGTLQLIYVALAAAAAEPATLLVRGEMYERLYRRALRSAVVDLDLNGDGAVDARRALGVLQLQRS